jgi:hypothetical protein
MKELYDIAGISKQALWKYKQRQLHVGETTEHIVNIMTDLRVRHKRMGCRSMYYATTEEISVGRDNFEKIGFANGFKLKRKPNKQKTTWSQRVMIFPNLIEGKVLNGINQVWQSDIFYIKIEGHDYYGVSIEDVYSRKLLALHFAKDIRAMQVERALRKALQIRKGMDLSGCIFHSDRGTQYISELVTQVLYNNHMQISMCKLPQENSYVERAQGTIKYQYLFEMNLKEKNLFSQAVKIMQYYNNERPHSSLQMNTPGGFEKTVENMAIEDRPKMQIFKWNWDLLTNSTFINKKEKSSKKEKSQTTTI